MFIISLEGIECTAPVGYHEEEQLLGSKLSIDVSVSIHHEVKGDEISNTVNYEELNRIVREVVMDRTHLLETCCHKISARLQKEFRDAEKIMVSIAKLNPPLSGKVNDARVTYEWVRE